MASLLRRLPLLCSGRPKTPLRVLCIVAFDVIHWRRSGSPLSKVQVRRLAALLDYGAMANAALDRKQYCQRNFRDASKLLKKSSLGPVVARYLRQLRDLERNRPSPLGGQCRFQAVRHYREAVMRLSLAMSAAAVADSQCLEEAIEATYHHEL